MKDNRDHFVHISKYEELEAKLKEAEARVEDRKVLPDVEGETLEQYTIRLENQNQFLLAKLKPLEGIEDVDGFMVDVKSLVKIWLNSDKHSIHQIKVAAQKIESALALLNETKEKKIV